MGCLGRGPPGNWPAPGVPVVRWDAPPVDPEGLRKIGSPRRMPPAAVPAPAEGGRSAAGGAVYTGRGPVCGITMRRAGSAGVGAAACACPFPRWAGGCASAAAARPAVSPGNKSACSGARAAASAAKGVSISTGSAVLEALAFVCGAAGVAAGAMCSGAGLAVFAGGLTTTATAGGATATAGRCATAGALATTALAGGRVAMAGGWATMGGAERGWGTILRGSGLAGVADGLTATTVVGAGRVGSGAGVAAVRFRGKRLLRASASSSCFLAWMAFSTSPGLEICERSIFGAMACGAREAGVLAALADRDARLNCARTLSASSSSSELE